ncbi:MAG TPA: VOC family protein [Gemmatirosa sp.]
MTARPAAASAVRITAAIPGLRYDDAPAAIGWLVDVLGAEARQVHPGPDGTVAHAELWFGGGCVMLGSVKDDDLSHRPGHGSIYLVMATPEAVDVLHARAVAAGARIVRPPYDTDYGSHDFSCADAEGNLWHVGTYEPA